MYLCFSNIIKMSVDKFGRATRGGSGGTVGPQGAKGARGEVGPQGSKGDRGEVGHPGPQGIPGAGYHLLPSGDYDLNLKKIRNMGYPVHEHDAVNKIYVDNKIIELNIDKKISGIVQKILDTIEREKLKK